MPQEHTALMAQPIAIAGSSLLRTEAIADCARFSLRIAPEHLTVASKALRCTLPSKIGAVEISGGRMVICLGPDEWQLYAPVIENETIQSAFSKLYAKCPHSLVDVGHREIGISVEGTAAVLALRSACAFDLETMAPGTGTRTIFDKAQIILIRHGHDRFRIEVWRSFTSHVWGLLQAASREIALGI